MHVALASALPLSPAWVGTHCLSLMHSPFGDMESDMLGGGLANSHLLSGHRAGTARVLPVGRALCCCGRGQRHPGSEWEWEAGSNVGKTL